MLASIAATARQAPVPRSARKANCSLVNCIADDVLRVMCARHATLSWVAHQDSRVWPPTPTLGTAVRSGRGALRRCIADPGARCRGSLRHACSPRPGRSVVISGIVASDWCRVDAKFRPPLPIGRDSTGNIDEDISFRVTLQPHSANQISQSGDASQPILNRADRLISAGERTPHFDDEMNRLIGINLPRDLERRAAQSVPVHPASPTNSAATIRATPANDGRLVPKGAPRSRGPSQGGNCIGVFFSRRERSDPSARIR